MEEKKKVILAGISFIVLVAVVAVVYLVFFRGREAVPETTSVEQAAVEKPTEKPVSEEGEDIPETLEYELDSSDENIRDLAGALSGRPELARWLLSGSLIRKFVATVDNIANGESPRRHIDFFQVEDEFPVLERDGTWYVDPQGYRRYDVVAEVFASLDTEGTVDLYRRLTPVLQSTYRDLGYPRGNFQATLMRAIEELLGVPIIEGDVSLEEKLESFALSSPQLEALSQAQKHLFRMGPRNVRLIQARLRELRSLLRQD
jgi:hypothetical protein